MMPKLAAALAAALLLAACGSGPQVAPPAVPPQDSPTPAPLPRVGDSQADPFAALRTFTLADLTAASQDAHAQPAQPGCSSGDCTAYACYDWLSTNLPALPGFQQGQTVGAILAFQKARDLANGLVGGSPFLASLNRACAPLVIDTQTTVNKLGLLAAGGAAANAAAGPVVGPLIGGGVP